MWPYWQWPYPGPWMIAGGNSFGSNASAGIRDGIEWGTARPTLGNSQPGSSGDTPADTHAKALAPSALTVTPDSHAKALALITESTPWVTPPRKVRKRRREPTPSTFTGRDSPEFDERLGHECPMMPCRHRLTGKKQKFHWEIPACVEMELAPLVGAVCV